MDSNVGPGTNKLLILKQLFSTYLFVNIKGRYQIIVLLVVFGAKVAKSTNVEYSNAFP